MSARTPTAALFQTGSQNRVLAACVLFSLMLHAVLLWFAPGIRERAPAAASVLTAILLRPAAMPEAGAPAAAPRTPERPRTARTKPLPEPPPSVPSSRDEQASVRPEETLAHPASALPVALAAVQPTSIVPAALQPPTPAPPQTQVAPVPRLAQATAPAAYAPDAGNLDQYRLALIGAARRYKRYPMEAVENGWTGKVEVQLVIGADGVIETALVKSSSGHGILDNQALDMIRKAKSLTPIPPALRGHEFSVDIPVIFDLQTG